MRRYALVIAFLGAAQLSAQTTDVDVRDRAIVAAALLEAPREGNVWARLYKLRDDTAVVAVLQTVLPRDTTPGETLIYFDTVVRRDGDWVSVGPRKTMPVVLPTRKYTPTKLAPPPPANRVSRP